MVRHSTTTESRTILLSHKTMWVVETNSACSLLKQVQIYCTIGKFLAWTNRATTGNLLCAWETSVIHLVFHYFKEKLSLLKSTCQRTLVTSWIYSMMQGTGQGTTSSIAYKSQRLMPTWAKKVRKANRGVKGWKKSYSISSLQFKDLVYLHWQALATKSTTSWSVKFFSMICERPFIDKFGLNFLHFKPKSLTWAQF